MYVYLIYLLGSHRLIVRKHALSEDPPDEQAMYEVATFLLISLPFAN